MAPGCTARAREAEPLAHRRICWLILAGGLLAACGGPIPHRYRVDRTALVPVPVPDASSGPPGDTLEVTASHSTILWADAPAKPPASNVGLYVPRHQPGLMVRWRPLGPQEAGRLEVDLRAGYEAGLRAGAYRVANNGLTAPPTANAFVYWGGYGLSQRFENGIRWSLTTDVMISDVQSRIRMECLDCEGPGDPVTSGTSREGLAGFRSQLLVGVKRGPVELALVGALRNHHVNEGTRKEALQNDEEARARVTTGVHFPVAGAAVGFHPRPRATITASIFWPIDPSGEAVRYGPIAGASVTIRAPRKE